MSTLGAYLHRSEPQIMTQYKILHYCLMILSEWAFVALICWGIHKNGIRLKQLIGDKRITIKSVLRDIGIAIGFLLASWLVLLVIAFFLKPGRSTNLSRILPRTIGELIVFSLVAVSAGIAEEIVFRGYLQAQFAGLLRSKALGLIVQGIVFGAAHGYQGTRHMIILGVFGCLFGLLAVWRRSLRPGMIAHALHDELGGVVALFLRHH